MPHGCLTLNFIGHCTVILEVFSILLTQKNFILLLKANFKMLTNLFIIFFILTTLQRTYVVHIIRKRVMKAIVFSYIIDKVSVGNHLTYVKK